MHDGTSESYKERENQWDQQWPSSAATSHDKHGPDEPDTGDGITPFPGVVGTTDSIEAVRDAEPYTPPEDPPVLPGGAEGIHIATGFGLGVEEEAASETRLRGDEDVHDEVMRALHHDSLASQYTWSVNVVHGVVRLRGAVPSLDDAEHAASVLGELPGVVDVVDNTWLDTSLS